MQNCTPYGSPTRFAPPHAALTSSYSWLNCASEVWYMQLTTENSAIRKYSSVARWATGRYSSHASLMRLLVSEALASFSLTSCAGYE